MGNKKPFQRAKTKRPGLKASRRVNQKNKKVSHLLHQLLVLSCCCEFADHSLSQVVVTDPTVARLWDKNDTVKRNFAKLGLASDANSVVEPKKDLGEEDDDDAMGDQPAAVAKTPLVAGEASPFSRLCVTQVGLC